MKYNYVILIVVLVILSACIASAENPFVSFQKPSNSGSSTPNSYNFGPSNYPGAVKLSGCSSCTNYNSFNYAPFNYGSSNYASLNYKLSDYRLSNYGLYKYKSSNYAPFNNPSAIKLSSGCSSCK